ncbi:hypothetical protein JD844_011400 [Phrynosoma platyrhinos]|uniref:Zinc-ribbon domain-containing protein n=1 Tax=Phrynosoma platyrhinos TaxID=52577 RepID=A0ABQ7THX3_PHRPL|nr:hypothetical protein JD844_011400 [Phrynosoma platyrhinos]
MEGWRGSEKREAGCKKRFTLGRKSRKKGFKCPKCGNSQNVSNNFCSNCGERLAVFASTQIAEKKDANMTSDVGMEPGGELKVESSPLLESSVVECTLTEQAQREPEQSLSKSLESQASSSQKKVSISRI